MSEKQVRVRFAPSPTGPLHIGGVRTALYNYLFARHHKGKMVLRIEDTDQARYVPGAEEYIRESLAWCGIAFDEGVEEGGGYGPYRQSERKDLYFKYADRLLRSGDAYFAFDTPEELDALRKAYEEDGKTFTYDSSVREGLKNSLTLDEDQVRILLDSDTPYVVRYKMPVDEELEFNDRIRGKIKVNTNTLDDKVLFKSDGMPTYHLANVVDDHLMEITHVIRGEEWLPSLPLHVLLYRSFKWQAPEFSHLPLILKPQGSGKLSKRDGDKMGFPVFPIEWKDPKTGDVASGYRESGYFPEAVVNMLALLGWNPGTEQELFSMEELVKAFTLDRVGKSGSRFDPEKARWFNHQYLQMKSDEEIAGLFREIIRQKGIDAEMVNIVKIVSIVKERANFVDDLWEQSGFFFEAPSEYDPKAIKKRWKENTPELLGELIKVLSGIDEFRKGPIHDAVEKMVSEKEIGMGQVMIPLRISLVGGTFGPDLTEVAEILGKEEVIKRIEKALEMVK
jgi:glutamyl-tRNA synthetase